MEEVRRNLLVGSFVLCGLVALGTLVVLFGRGPTALVSGGTYPLHVYFAAVSDVRPGNLVTARGIQIGHVTSVDLVDPKRFEAGVDVIVAIQKQYSIPEGSSAQTTEVMLGQGRPPIEILAGKIGAEPLQPGASLKGSIRGAMESIFPPGVVDTLQTSARQIGDAAEALTPVLDEMKEVLQKRTPEQVDRGLMQGNLSSAVARFDSALRHFNEVLGDGQVKSQLRETVANVHDMSEQGKVVAADLQKAAADGREMMADGRKLIAKVDATVDKLDTRTADVTRGIMTSLDDMDRFLDYLNVVGQQVASGQGNFGQLVMDNKLYDSLVITAERLSMAVDEFRALIAEWRQGKIKVAL